MINTKYPNQLISFKKKNTDNTYSTFSMESYLTIAKGSVPEAVSGERQEKPDSPLHICDEKYSRMKGILINKGVPATFNIPIESLPDIVECSRIARKMQLEYDCRPKVTGTSIAYTQQLTGRLAGKTPAEVFLSDPQGGGQALKSHYEWLKENSSNPKYQKSNEAQMKAIMEASRLASEGKLKGEETGFTPSVVLFEQGMRPIVRQKHADGKCFVYESRIVYHIGRNYPVSIEVKNYYAPVKISNDGLYNVQASQIDQSTLVQNKYVLSKEDWSACVFWMEQNLKAFMNTNFTYCYEAANQIHKANADAAISNSK